MTNGFVTTQPAGCSSGLVLCKSHPLPLLLLNSASGPSAHVTLSGPLPTPIQKAVFGSAYLVMQSLGSTPGTGNRRKGSVH